MRVMRHNRSKPRVFHVLGLSGLGGVQRQFELVAPYLLEDPEFCHAVVSFQKPEPAYPQAASMNLGYTGFLGCMYSARSSNNIVHSYNNLTSSRYLKLYSWLRPENLVFHERGNAWNLVDSLIPRYQKNAEMAKLVICNSRATSKYLQYRFGIPESKLRVVHNGLEIPSLKEVRSSVKPVHSGYVVGYIGRLEPHKGVHCLIEAMSYLPERVKSKIQLRIAGSGSAEASLKELARMRNVPAEFCGRVVSPDRFYHEIDVLVVPSIREPLGNVAIEAGLHGLPVIASQVDGLPEVVRDNESGLLLKPSQPFSMAINSFVEERKIYAYDPDSDNIKIAKQLSPQDLSRALTTYFDQPELGMRHGRGLQERVTREFSVEKYLADMSAIYRSILI